MKIEGARGPSVFLMYGVPVIVTFIVSAFFSRLGVDPYHDGFMLKTAVDVGRGRMLFTETFTQYGALTSLLQGWTLKVFGETLVSLKIMTAGVYALIAGTLVFVGRRVLPPVLLVATWLAWLLTAPYYTEILAVWSSVYALFFQMLSLCFVFHYIRSGRFAALMASGVAANLVFWCRQPVGVFCFLALSVSVAAVLFVRRRPAGDWVRAFACFIGGSLAVAAAFLAWIWLNGAWHDWYLQSFKLAYDWARMMGRGEDALMVLRKLFPLHTTPLWLLMPVIVAAVTFLSLRRLKAGSGQEQALYVFAGGGVCLASWLQYYPVADYQHLYWAATPLVPFVVVAIRDAAARFSSGRQTIVVAAIIVLLFGYDAAVRLAGGVERVRQLPVAMGYPTVLAGMRVSAVEADSYGEIGRAIDAYRGIYPDAGLVMAWRDPLYLALTPDKPNFHPLFVPWAWVIESIYPDYFSARARYLSANRSLILSRTADVVFPGYRTVRTGGLYLHVPAW